MKPVLTLEIQAGRPNVKWVKSGMQGINLYVNHGNGVFVFLARDTEPDYLDTTALPAAGQSALWKYKACYCLHDRPHRVNVGGQADGQEGLGPFVEGDLDARHRKQVG